MFKFPFQFLILISQVRVEWQIVSLFLQFMAEGNILQQFQPKKGGNCSKLEAFHSTCLPFQQLLHNLLQMENMVKGKHGVGGNDFDENKLHRSDCRCLLLTKELLQHQLRLRSGPGLKSNVRGIKNTQK